MDATKCKPLVPFFILDMVTTMNLQVPTGTTGTTLMQNSAFKDVVKDSILSSLVAANVAGASTLNVSDITITEITVGGARRLLNVQVDFAGSAAARNLQVSSAVDVKYEVKVEDSASADNLAKEVEEKKIVVASKMKEKFEENLLAKAGGADATLLGNLNTIVVESVVVAEAEPKQTTPRDKDAPTGHSRRTRLRDR